MGADAEHSRRVNRGGGRWSSRSHHIGLIGRSVYSPHHHQRIATGIGDIRRDSRGRSAGRGAIQCDRAGTNDGGSCVTILVRADVNDSAHDPRESALVGGRSIRVVAGVDGWTAAEQCVGEGRPAVVLQRPQLKGCGTDVELIAEFRGNRTTRGAKQVEAIGQNVSKFATEKVNRRGVRGDDCAFEFHRTPRVENPSAILQETAGNNVGSNGAVGQCHTAEIVEDTATRGASATTRDVATHGAVVHIHGAVIVGESTALTRTATLAARGRIAADRASVQRYRTKIVCKTATLAKSCTTCATPSDVATQGAVVHIYGAEPVVDAAAESAAVVRGAVGGVVVDNFGA